MVSQIFFKDASWQPMGQSDSTKICQECHFHQQKDHDPGVFGPGTSNKNPGKSEKIEVWMEFDPLTLGCGVVGPLDGWMDYSYDDFTIHSPTPPSLVGQIFNLILGEEQLKVLSIDPLIHGLPEVQGRVPWKCSPMTMSLEDPVDNCVPGCMV